MTSLRKFLRTAGLANLTVSDLATLDVEAKDWEITYRRKKKQAGEIPVSVVIAWENIVPDSKNDIAERIFAWSFRLAAAAGLRWDDLLNTPPTTLVLLKRGSLGLQQRPKIEERLREYLGGLASSLFLTKIGWETGWAFPNRSLGISHEITG